MLYLVLLALAVGCLILEQMLHRRRLQRIPLRIHVNGTRGKTTVVRLTAELLRCAGIRTLAKTTGDHPELILPAGRHRRLQRKGPARIHEQLTFIAEAGRQKAQAVVVECMALDEQLQDVSEHLMMRSTIGVITNVRPDHFEVMGSSLDQVAQSLSRTIPACAVLVTESGPYESMLRERCEAAGTQICVPARNSAGSGAQGARCLMEENLDFVRLIGQQAGLPAATIDRLLAEMAAREQPRALLRMGAGSERMVLLDAFSANDTVSAAQLQEEFLSADAEWCPRPIVALLNARADRPLRTVAFVEYMAARTCFDAIGLTGDGRWLARRRLRRLSPPMPLFALTPCAPARMLALISKHVGASSFTLVGLGNHRGAGEVLRNYFLRKGAPCC